MIAPLLLLALSAQAAEQLRAYRGGAQYSLFWLEERSGASRK
jgi:hypothetical protein